MFKIDPFAALDSELELELEVPTIEATDRWSVSILKSSDDRAPISLVEHRHPFQQPVT